MPLTLAVGFAMIAAYASRVPSSRSSASSSRRATDTETDTVRDACRSSTGGSRSTIRIVARAVRLQCWIVAPAYLELCVLVLVFMQGLQVGTELFPQVDSGQFVLRLRSPPGSNFELTREFHSWARNAWRRSKRRPDPTTSRSRWGTRGRSRRTSVSTTWCCSCRRAGRRPVAGRVHRRQPHQIGRVPGAAPQGVPRARHPLACAPLSRLGRTGPSRGPAPRAALATYGFAEPGDIVSSVMSFKLVLDSDLGARDRHRNGKRP